MNIKNIVYSYAECFSTNPFYLKLLSGLLLILTALISGFYFEKLVLKRVFQFASKSKLKSDEVIIDSLRGTAIQWFLLGGGYVASFFFPLNAEHLSLFRKILLVIWIFSVTYFISKLSTGLINQYSRKTKAEYRSASILSMVISISIFIIGFLVIMQTLGVSITPVLTTLGIGGFAVALALQDTLSNLFSGLHIIASRQINTGDFIRLDTGEDGYVVDISWRNVSIRELSNNIIIVPNSKIAKATLRNYDLPEQTMSVLVAAGVSYGSSLRHVEKVTVEAAKEVLKSIKGGISEFEPFIRFHTFDDFSINFTVIFRVREFVDQFLVKHEFIMHLHEKYQEEGIEIPFPVRTLHIKEKNAE
ncbi:MAG: mechanosensitive ion channel family protein [bacterium]|nr:mechanosensitive ion channel family protein [bacterium]